MPRCKPQYIWPITAGKPLKGEPANKRVSYKSGGKKYKTSKEPASFPASSQGQGNVQYGSHSEISKLIGAEMIRLGL